MNWKENRIGFRPQDGSLPYWFTPLPDITPFELALLMNFFFHASKPRLQLGEFKLERLLQDILADHLEIERHFERFEK